MLHGLIFPGKFLSRKISEIMTIMLISHFNENINYEEFFERYFGQCFSPSNEEARCDGWLFLVLCSIFHLIVYSFSEGRRFPVLANLRPLNLLFSFWPTLESGGMRHLVILKIGIR